jgi:hypothetical protein
VGPKSKINSIVLVFWGMTTSLTDNGTLFFFTESIFFAFFVFLPLFVEPFDDAFDDLLLTVTVGLAEDLFEGCLDGLLVGIFELID